MARIYALIFAPESTRTCWCGGCGGFPPLSQRAFFVHSNRERFTKMTNGQRSLWPECRSAPKRSVVETRPAQNRAGGASGLRDPALQNSHLPKLHCSGPRKTSSVGCDTKGGIATYALAPGFAFPPTHHLRQQPKAHSPSSAAAAPDASISTSHPEACRSGTNHW